MLNGIKTKKQYEDALERVFSLMQKSIVNESKQSDDLEVLSIQIKEYEREQFPISKPNAPGKR